MPFKSKKRRHEYNLAYNRSFYGQIRRKYSSKGNIWSSALSITNPDQTAVVFQYLELKSGVWKGKYIHESKNMRAFAVC